MIKKHSQASRLPDRPLQQRQDVNQKIGAMGGKRNSMVNTRVELATLALLAPRSNQLS
jgi:hypothetical protein